MTIEEMAKKFALIEKGQIDGVEYTDYDSNKYDGFMFGSNYVLEEIQSCWDWKENANRLIVPVELVLHRIEDKIKELKGE